METDASQVSDVVDSAKQKTQEQVGEVAEKGRGVVRDQVDQRSTQAGEQARGAAHTLRQAAVQARGEGNDQHARLAEQGAERLDRLGGYLTDADGDEILWRVEDVARRQPLLVAGAGLLLGIAFARVLKASSHERAQQSRTVNRNGRHSEPLRSPSLPTAASTAPSFLAEGELR